MVGFIPLDPLKHENLALALVLLPDAASEIHILKLNRELVAQAERSTESSIIELGILPRMARAHLTLSMGVSSSTGFAATKTKLAEIAAAHAPLVLREPRHEHRPSQNASGVSWMAFDDHEAVQALHRRATQILKPSRGTISENTQFFNHDSVLPDARNYFELFGTNSALDRFEPHITLGYGKLHHPRLPSQITCNRLALYWLGPHGTMVHQICEELFKTRPE